MNEVSNNKNKHKQRASPSIGHHSFIFILLSCPLYSLPFFVRCTQLITNSAHSHLSEDNLLANLLSKLPSKAHFNVIFSSSSSKRYSLNETNHHLSSFLCKINSLIDIEI